MNIQTWNSLLILINKIVIVVVSPPSLLLFGYFLQLLLHAIRTFKASVVLVLGQVDALSILYASLHLPYYLCIESQFS